MPFENSNPSLAPDFKEITKKSFKLLLIRHGETDANLTPEHIGGRCPFAELSEIGVIETIQLGEYLKKKEQKMDTIFISPLLRAVETADICLKTMGKEELLKIAIMNSRLEEFS
jgi:broad specificity phosphatase PhoE